MPVILLAVVGTISQSKLCSLALTNHVWHTVIWGGMQWHVVIHGGMQWHVVAHSDTQWYVVTCGGTQWHMVAHGDTQWHTVAHGSMQQHVVTCGGIGLHGETPRSNKASDDLMWWLKTNSTKKWKSLQFSDMNHFETFTRRGANHSKWVIIYN